MHLENKALACLPPSDLGLPENVTLENWRKWCAQAALQMASIALHVASSGAEGEPMLLFSNRGKSLIGTGFASDTSDIVFGPDSPSPVLLLWPWRWSRLSD